MKANLLYLGILVGIIAITVYMNQARLEHFMTYVFVPRFRRWRGGWRPRYVTYVEGYEGKDQQQAVDQKQEEEEEEVYQFRPDTPAKADLDVNKTYTLLTKNDGIEPMPAPGSISCTNSQSCYLGDFSHLLEQGGNFRQLTNNYKHSYPDSCSSPFQELVMPFYRSPGLAVPSATAGCI